MDPKAIEKLAHLAKLNIAEDQLDEVTTSITNMLALVDQLQAADTAQVLPMAHPLDANQRLRADEVTETNQREPFLNLAPTAEDGLYLVPKVLD